MKNWRNLATQKEKDKNAFEFNIQIINKESIEATASHMSHIIVPSELTNRQKGKWGTEITELERDRL